MPSVQLKDQSKTPFESIGIPPNWVGADAARDSCALRTEHCCNATISILLAESDA
jgi:hypothetical protein